MMQPLQGQINLQEWGNNMSATQAIVYYHANCADGFGAAWAFHQLREDTYEHTQYIPSKYEVPPTLEYGLGKDINIYILDFSFAPDILVQMCQAVNQVILIDHHKTAIEMLENWPEVLPKNSNLYLKLDQTRSGAGLTWDFFTTKPRPALINYIEDRDLWKFTLPDSKELNAVIANTEYDFESWSSLQANLCYDYAGLCQVGEHLLAQHSRICNQIIQDARSITIEDSNRNKHTGLACNCTHQFASDVGNLLAIRSGTFGACYFQNAKGDVKFSLRSNGDYDVSQLAKSYGGGGHKNAAGFTLCNAKEDGNITIWQTGVENVL